MMRYDPTLNNYFTVYESAKPVKLENPFDDPPYDISDWAIGVSDIGIPIVKSNVVLQEEETLLLPTATFNSNPEYEGVPILVELEVSLPDQTVLLTKVVLSKFKSKDLWATTLALAYRNLGVSENGIRNLIAKNALESNWGRSAQGVYNYGNITTGSSWKGNYVNGRDKNGKGLPIRNKFRSYNSIEEFAKDEVNFLKRLYDFDDSDSIDIFLDKLKGKNKGGRHYAEASDYKSRVKSVYNLLK